MELAAPLVSGSREWEDFEALRTQGLPSARGMLCEARSPHVRGHVPRLQRTRVHPQLRRRALISC